MIEAEYRERYRTHIASATGDQQVADAATDALAVSEEDLDEADPEGDADNEMSYWEDDE